VRVREREKEKEKEGEREGEMERWRGKGKGCKSREWWLWFLCVITDPLSVHPLVGVRPSCWWEVGHVFGSCPLLVFSRW